MISGRIASSVMQSIGKYSAMIDSFSDRIEALSPINVLKRGYSAVTKDNTTVASIKDVAVGDNIRILMSDGCATAQITDITANKEK